MSTWIKLCVSP